MKMLKTFNFNLFLLKNGAFFNEISPFNKKIFNDAMLV